MDNGIETIEILDYKEYKAKINDHFEKIPKIARPFTEKAKDSLLKIESLLYSSSAFLNVLESSIPKHSLQAILSKEQEYKLASGALELMTKKDGSLLANLVNPKTKQIVSQVRLREIQLTPELSNAITSFGTQMQIAQIAEQIECITLAIDDVRTGQENDRLALAYSCKQKFLQTMSIKDETLKKDLLLQTISDAEDSRNLLMLSQKETAQFIANLPENTIGKLLGKIDQEDIDKKVNELRDGLSAININSLIEASSYQLLGEDEAAKMSLSYYGDFIYDTYLSRDGFVKRLDLLDASPVNYWSEKLPMIEKNIEALPINDDINLLLEEKNNE